MASSIFSEKSKVIFSCFAIVVTIFEPTELCQRIIPAQVSWGTFYGFNFLYLQMICYSLIEISKTLSRKRS